MSYSPNKSSDFPAKTGRVCMFFHIITEYETEFNTLCGILGRETGHLAGGVISCRGADAAPLKSVRFLRLFAARRAAR
jgi:hypothetical protein